MRFESTALAALCFAAAAQAAVPLKPILVSYPPETQDSVMVAAKNAITKAGGEITHVYDLFKGFAANAPDSILSAAVVKAGGATIEDDSQYSAQPDKNGIS